jgi:MFS transporter
MKNPTSEGQGPGKRLQEDVSLTASKRTSLAQHNEEPKAPDAIPGPAPKPSELESKTVEQSHSPKASPVDDPAAANYNPRSINFWLVMLSNFVAIFLVALDRTILATAIPRITDDFKSLGDIGWYGSAYMLTTAASQLLFGRIYKFYNLRMFVATPIFSRIVSHDVPSESTSEASSFSRSGHSSAVPLLTRPPSSPAEPLQGLGLQASSPVP